jgi:hypothetical protein
VLDVVSATIHGDAVAVNAEFSGLWCVAQRSPTDPLK